MQLKSLLAARSFNLLAARESAPNNLTGAALQALLYLAQGWHLAREGRPLFPERIEAWKWGPVVPEVFLEHAQYGDAPIPPPADVPPLAPLEAAFVAAVWEDYRNQTEAQLIELVRSSAPWRAARGPLRPDEPSRAPIDLDLLRSHFRAQLPPPLRLE